MKRTYHFTATVSDGTHHVGECAGTVRATSEATAREAVAEWVRMNGADKGRTWRATRIELR